MRSKPDTGSTTNRAVVISLGIAAFLFLFRPFGLSIDNLSEALIVSGFAPLNFIAMAGAHRLNIADRKMKAIVGLALILSANFAYVLFWQSGRAIFPTALNVMLIASLTVGAVLFWNRQRALAEEILTLKASKKATKDLIALRGESANEILRIPAEALRYLKAQGNYVEVRHRKAGAATSTLMRGTLAELAAQAGDKFLTRCHRSYFVNLDAAQRLVSKADGMRVEFEDGDSIPVSRAYRSAIRKAASA